MSLDDTSIDIYLVVARNGDKSTNTLGVVAQRMLIQEIHLMKNGGMKMHMIFY